MLSEIRKYYYDFSKVLFDIHSAWCVEKDLQRIIDNWKGLKQTERFSNFNTVGAFVLLIFFIAAGY